MFKMPSARFSLLIFFSLFSISSLFAQDNKELARQLIEQAELTMADTRAEDIARELYVAAAEADPENLKANFQAGYYHIITIGKDLAAKYFLKVYALDPNYRFDIEYWIARSYHYGLEFDRAIDFYNRYKQKHTARADYRGRDKVDLAVIDRHIFECENGKRYVANPGNFAIVNLGSSINSEYEDYAPVLNEAENEMVFTTRRRDGNLNQNVDQDNKPFEDIFYAKKNSSSWSRAENIGAPVNTIFHDSNLALSADGKTLFLYNDVNNGDIFISTKQASGAWSAPAPIPGLINSSYTENSVSISPDGNVLYFSSNRPGGFGGLDLYMATKDSKGAWTRIKNLGPKINTQYDEEGAFIDYDGKTLYFSSRGHKGMGGHDIYKSVYDAANDEWSEPENLGYPINTPDEDVYYVSTKDGKRAYYASVRDDGFGYTDIYMITIPDKPIVKEPVKVEEPVVVETKPEEKPAEVRPVETKPTEPATVPVRFLVNVVDESNSPLDVKIKLEGLPGNIVMPQSRLSAGVYQFTISSTTASNYRLSIEQEGYMFQNQNISIPGASNREQNIERKITMRRLSTGYSTVLRNIYFDFNKATFKEASYNELNKLERMMKQNDRMKVEIAGHTDVVGSKTYNKALSLRRANAVRDFLTSKGVDARRISTVGYGAEKPLASNDDEEEGRELNRRVEFRVVEN